MLGKILRICNETGFGMYHGCRNMSSSPAGADRRVDFEDGGTFGRGRDMLAPWMKTAMDLRQFGIRNARIHLSRDKRRVPQQALDMTYVGAFLKKMSRKRMPDHVRRNPSQPR